MIGNIANELDGVLLIDEAYVDFVDPSLRHDVVNMVRAFDNVLLLRTLSKGYSLAGLRFGYGIGSPNLIEPMLTKTRDSYNVDAIAQSVACAGFADLEYAETTWSNVRSERRRLRDALRSRGFDVPPSQTNFLLATVPHRKPARRRGVVRRAEVPRHPRALFRRAAPRRQTAHQHRRPRAERPTARDDRRDPRIRQPLSVAALPDAQAPAHPA